MHTGFFKSPPHYESTQTQRVWGFLRTLSQMMIVSHKDKLKPEHHCQALSHVR